MTSVRVWLLSQRKLFKEFLFVFPDKLLLVINSLLISQNVFILQIRIRSESVIRVYKYPCLCIEGIESFLGIRIKISIFIGDWYASYSIISKIFNFEASIFLFSSRSSVFLTRVLGRYSNLTCRAIEQNCRILVSVLNHQSLELLDFGSVERLPIIISIGT